MEKYEEHILNLQPLKPKTLNPHNDILTPAPHTPFLFQPLSPAEHQCYIEKSLNYVGYIRNTAKPYKPHKPYKKQDFRWNCKVDGNEEGDFDESGNYVVAAARGEVLWMVSDVRMGGPFTGSEMTKMMEEGLLHGKEVKRVDDESFVLFGDLVEGVKDIECKNRAGGKKEVIKDEEHKIDIKKNEESRKIEKQMNSLTTQNYKKDADKKDLTNNYNFSKLKQELIDTNGNNKMFNPFVSENLDLIFKKSVSIDLQKKIPEFKKDKEYFKKSSELSFEEREKINLHCNKSKSFLEQRGYKELLIKLVDVIRGKIKLECLKLIKKETGMKEYDCEDFLELLIRESKIKLCKDVDSDGFVSANKNYKKK
ncbi:hypothetical protein COBT_002277 [Conglomerata obtusa]